MSADMVCRCFLLSFCQGSAPFGQRVSGGVSLCLEIVKLFSASKSEEKGGLGDICE